MKHKSADNGDEDEQARKGLITVTMRWRWREKSGSPGKKRAGAPISAPLSLRNIPPIHYKYDNVGNIIQSIYPDGSSERITYLLASGGGTLLR